MANVSEIITSKIVEELEQGVMPWSKPWKTEGGQHGLRPYNFTTGKAYKGVNWITLLCSDFDSWGWATWKQIKKAGGSVKRGQEKKYNRIVFWNIFEKEDEVTGEVTKRFVPRYFNVYNFDQTEGLEHLNPLSKTSEEDLKNAIPKTWETDEKSLQAISSLEKVPAKLEDGGTRAYYKPLADIVAMPHKTLFDNPKAYCSTFAHELSHWTGHESRLKRKFGKRFGDKAYAMEELVAELSAAFVCAELGLAYSSDHASYIGSWIKVLKQDSKAIFTAARMATESCELLMTEMGLS
jgi:antirestriction protein ArdC